jgi:hypothetical protein
VDGHYLEVVASEVMKLGEEGRVGGAAVWRSKDGGAEDHFKASLDILDQVLNHIAGNRFSTTLVGMAPNTPSASSGNNSQRAGNCGRRCKQGNVRNQQKKTLTEEMARGHKRIGTTWQNIHYRRGSNSSGGPFMKHRKGQGVRRKLRCGGGDETGVVRLGVAPTEGGKVG